MSLKSSWSISEDGEDVYIKCRDPFLDRDFFEKFLLGIDWPHDVHIYIEDMKEVILDLSGLNFHIECEPDYDDEGIPYPEPPISLGICSNVSTEVTLLSKTKTGLGQLFLEDNKSYNLSNFNGEGIEEVVLDAPLDGLVMSQKNFPSPLGVVVRQRNKDVSPGGPIQLRNLSLTSLIVGKYNGDILLTRVDIAE